MIGDGPDERLLNAVRDAWAAEGTGCPPPHVWLAESLVELDETSRVRLEGHARECPACAAERRLAAAFDTPAREFGREEDIEHIVGRLRATVGPALAGAAMSARADAVQPDTHRRWRAPAVWLAAAATVLLTVSLGLESLLQPAAPPLPDAAPSGVMRGAHVEVIAPSGEVEALPAELRWEPLAAAVAYRVTLLSAGDTLLWSTTTTAAAVKLPSEVRKQLHGAARYRWQVQALGNGDAPLALSEMVSFRAPPDSPSSEVMP